MNRLFSVTAIIFSLATFISCSGPANVAKQGTGETTELQKYPGWYAQQPVVNTDSVMYGYATAIDDDSASSVSKAVAWAKAELRSSVSASLEDIRDDALAESGNGSGLDSPDFLFALQKVGQAVNSLASTSNTEVRTVEGFKSYRSFAEITVPKEELVKSIEGQLEGYEKAWNAMKQSQAFQEF